MSTTGVLDRNQSVVVVFANQDDGLDDMKACGPYFFVFRQIWKNLFSGILNGKTDRFQKILTTRKSIATPVFYNWYRKTNRCPVLLKVYHVKICYHWPIGFPFVLTNGLE